MVTERDAPYPELKKTHTAAHKGMPWRDFKPPASAPVWNVIQGYGNYWLLVAAIELDVFDTLERLGKTAVEPVAEAIGAPVVHTRFLLDGLVAMGMIEQYRDVYELGELAERYLTTNGPASMASLVDVAPGPLANWEELADTIRRGRPAHPIEDDPVAFYKPLVEATFVTILRAATRADLKIGYSRSVAQPRVLDLGAGGAPWAIAILKACAGATAVVNDLEGVIEVAAEKLAEHGVFDRAELRAGDFHTIEIEPASYDYVVLGHVCRAEGEQGARRLVERAFAALKPEGRLLLSDYFPDNTRTYNPFGVLMGVTMMAATERGFTFTHQQFTNWLQEAGFEAVRLVEPIGFQQVFVASKPRVAGSTS
jgi:ubiquinone/menaquinone biosynthesis C-methylase UbiE